MSVRLRALPSSQPELITKLNVTRRKELEAFLIALREPSMTQLLDDDGVFTQLIDLSISDYGVKQTELAELLGISTAAVGRWRAGKNAPAGYGRVHIISVVGDLLAARLAQTFEKTP